MRVAKSLICVLYSLAVVLVAGCYGLTPSRYPDHTVHSVGLKAYSGKWYEIASFPNWFQKDCYCTTAQYADRGDYIEVINSCRRGGPDGAVEVAKEKGYDISRLKRTQQLCVQ